MSEAQNIQFELVSPERKLFSEPVYHAVIPGTEGELGIGVDHAKFVVALQPGLVKVYAQKEDEKPQEIFIAGGFADVAGKSCTVLAEEAVNINDLDRSEIEKEIKLLEHDIALAEEAADKTRLNRKLDIAKTKLSYI